MNDPTALPACPVEVTLSLISNRWKTLIIRDLLEGTKRFSELQRSVGGISQKVLTQNLRAMEADGLVSRTIYAEVPPRVEYALTPLGESLEIVLDAMHEWGEGYQAAVRASLESDGVLSSVRVPSEPEGMRSTYAIWSKQA